MKFYANIRNNKLEGATTCICTSQGLIQIEITEDVYNNIQRYEYKDGQIVEIEDYDEKQRKAKRKAEILQELDTLDSKSIRGLRANETERLAEIEAQAEALREELRNL